MNLHRLTERLEFYKGLFLRFIASFSHFAFMQLKNMIKDVRKETILLNE